MTLDSILETEVSDELRFLRVEFTDQIVHNLLPTENVLFNLSIEVIHSFLFNLWSDAFFINKLFEQFLHWNFDLTYNGLDGIIDLISDNSYARLIEPLVLVEHLHSLFDDN